jgi:hypothetical protein
MTPPLRALTVTDGQFEMVAVKDPQGQRCFVSAIRGVVDGKEHMDLAAIKLTNGRWGILVARKT